MKFVEVYVNGKSRTGNYFENVCLVISENYTRAELERAAKNKGLRTYKTQNMTRHAKVPKNI